MDRFRADGRLESIASAADDRNPGAPTYFYDDVPLNVIDPPVMVKRLTRITDATGRNIHLYSAPPASVSAPGGHCFVGTAPPGFEVAVVTAWSQNPW